jgi:hypothetical protein
MPSTIFGHGGKRKRGKKYDDNSESSDMGDDFADEATDDEPEVENDDSDLDGITDPEDIVKMGQIKQTFLMARLLTLPASSISTLGS